MIGSICFEFQVWVGLAGLVTIAQLVRRLLYHALLDHMLMRQEYLYVMAALKDITVRKVN